MKLRTRLMDIQRSDGAMTDEALSALTMALSVPLQRLDGLHSFYPVFKKTHGAPKCLQVCRDIVCRMRRGSDHYARAREVFAGRPDVEVEEVSCIGRCDYAPASLISVFGSGVGFELEVFVSPGGYIPGEETALLEALEDRRGEPRNKPPFPTNAELWASLR